MQARQFAACHLRSRGRLERHCKHAQQDTVAVQYCDSRGSSSAIAKGHKCEVFRITSIASRAWTAAFSDIRSESVRMRGRDAVVERGVESWRATAIGEAGGAGVSLDSNDTRLPAARYGYLWRQGVS